MRRLWRRLVSHSMVARLLVAQMFVLCLLWLLALVYVVHDATRDKVTLELGSTYDAIFAVAGNELTEPAKMRESIRKVEAALRDMAGVDMSAFPGPSFIVENSEQSRAGSLPH